MNKLNQTKVFIVDDNPNAVAVLQLMLKKNYSVEIVGTAYDAESARIKIERTEPDLIFLDVELPTMSGLEFCSMIQEELLSDPKVIFYTGHEKYMLDAIRRQAFDYLLKPPTEQDLAQLMTRYYEDKLASMSRLNCMETQAPIILVVNDKNEHTTMQIDDIAFFRYNAGRKIWEVICVDQNTYQLRHRSTADVILNYSPNMVQIHKRYIVNISKIKRIYKCECVLKEPMEHIDELKISKNYRALLMDSFYTL